MSARQNFLSLPFLIRGGIFPAATQRRTVLSDASNISAAFLRAISLIGAPFASISALSAFISRPIWFDAERADPSIDLEIEAKLKRMEPSLDCSVKNQSGQHIRNGDSPYGLAMNAIRIWPETATAVAVRRGYHCDPECAAPYGLASLLGLRVRRSPSFQTNKRPIYVERVLKKRCNEPFPILGSVSQST
jgi:hypothetical protein